MSMQQKNSAKKSCTARTKMLQQFLGFDFRKNLAIKKMTSSLLTDELFEYLQTKQKLEPQK